MGLCRRWGGGLGVVLSLKFARAELTPTFVARAGTFSPNNGKGLMIHDTHTHARHAVIVMLYSLFFQVLLRSRVLLVEYLLEIFSL